MNNRAQIKRNDGHRFNSVQRDTQIYKENLRLLSNISAIMMRDNDDYNEQINNKHLQAFKS